jgi:hypothetical protein
MRPDASVASGRLLRRCHARGWHRIWPHGWAGEERRVGGKFCRYQLDRDPQVDNPG